MSQQTLLRQRENKPNHPVIWRDVKVKGMSTEVISTLILLSPASPGLTLTPGPQEGHNGEL